MYCRVLEVIRLHRVRVTLMLDNTTGVVFESALVDEMICLGWIRSKLQ